MIAITCRKCGTKFDRQRRNERVCDRCKPRWQKAAREARTATRPAGMPKDFAAHPAIPESQSSLAFAQVNHPGRKAWGSAGGNFEAARIVTGGSGPHYIDDKIMTAVIAAHVVTKYGPGWLEPFTALSARKGYLYKPKELAHMPDCPCGPCSTDWSAFYRELYTRLGLDEYLPKVLAELSATTTETQRKSA
jgi:hypothetical protein